MKKNLKKELQEKKKKIEKFMIDFLEKEELIYQEQKLRKIIFQEIKEFVVSGKMARGSIFIISSEILNSEKKNNENNQKNQVKIAAALELIHSGLLIHDDIIDQDQKRRSRNSVWKNFSNQGKIEGCRNEKLYGESLAICTANICYYLANTLITSLDLPIFKKDEIAKIINEEIIRVNFAEMLDVKLAFQKNDPQLDEILNMYQYKTARYTFSLPLLLASKINSQADNLGKQLIKIGEILGIIFQIKDDEIGIFAKEDISGKTVASDIKEGKKTIFYHFLMQGIEDKNEKKKFLNIFAKKELSKKEIDFTRKLFKKYSIPKIDKIVEQLEKLSLIEIEKLKSLKLENLLKEILNFNLQRIN